MKKYSVLQLNSNTICIKRGNISTVIRFGGIMNVIGRFLHLIDNYESELVDEVGIVDTTMLQKIIEVSTPPMDVLLSIPQMFQQIENFYKQNQITDEIYSKFERFKTMLDPEDLNVLYDNSPTKKPELSESDGYQVHEDDPLRV